MTAIAIPRTFRISRPQVTFRAVRVWQRNRDVYFNVWRSELIWPSSSRSSRCWRWASASATSWSSTATTTTSSSSARR